MPKIKNNAFKKAQQLIQERIFTEESTVSEEYSHIPIANLQLSLEHLNMEPQAQTTQESGNDQMARMIQAIENISARLTQQELQWQSTNGNQGIAHQRSDPIPREVTISGDPFRIPDPIKMLPIFNGNKKQLASWIETEKTLRLFENLVSPQIFEIYVTAVINKIEGHAKDVICTNGNPKTFSEVKEILITSLGDKQDLSTYNCQLWHNKMDGNANTHYQKTKELVHNIKSLAKQNPKYNLHWDAINDFIDEYSLAAYVSGLQKPYFGYEQAAEPKSIENAYAFICKFTSNESNRNLTHIQLTQSKQYLGNSHTAGQGNNKKQTERKFNNTKITQPQQQDYKPRKPVDTNLPPEPMEIGSTKSRLTLNKKQLFNAEITKPSDNEESESEDELDINFCLIHPENKNT